MAIEIERKFLVTSEAWRDTLAIYFCQGYLNRDRGAHRESSSGGQARFPYG